MMFRSFSVNSQIFENELSVVIMPLKCERTLFAVLQPTITGHLLSRFLKFHHRIHCHKIMEKASLLPSKSLITSLTN